VTWYILAEVHKTANHVYYVGYENFDEQLSTIVLLLQQHLDEFITKNFVVANSVKVRVKVSKVIW
jgi:hypothetical protein